MTALLKSALDPTINKNPGTIILGLFLAPDNLFSIRIKLQLLDQGVMRERIELFQPDDGHVRAGLPRPLGSQVIEDLTGTQDNFSGVGNGLRVCQDWLETRVRAHLSKRRNGFLMAKQRLGREDDQRLAAAACDLAAQSMETISRACDVADA